MGTDSILWKQVVEVGCLCGRTYVRTNGQTEISFQFTGRCPLQGPLSKKQKQKKEIKHVFPTPAFKNPDFWLYLDAVINFVLKKENPVSFKNPDFRARC